MKYLPDDGVSEFPLANWRQEFDALIERIRAGQQYERHALILIRKHTKAWTPERAEGVEAIRRAVERR